MTAEIRYHVGSGAPPSAATLAALEALDARRTYGLTKAYWGQGQRTGFTHGPNAAAACEAFRVRLDGSDNLATIPADACCYVDAEDDNDPTDHEHDWRAPRWQDATLATVKPAAIDLMTIVAWLRGHRPLASAGMFQQVDYDPASWPFSRWWKQIHDGCDTIEPGAYHLARRTPPPNGPITPNLAKDMKQIGRRIDTAVAVRQRRDQKILAWIWAHYQGGGLIEPIDKFEEYVATVWNHAPIDGVCLFQANTTPPEYVEVVGAVLGL